MAIRVPGKKSWSEFRKDLYSYVCFSIYFFVAFLIVKETSFAIYAVDRTSCVIAENFAEVAKLLEQDSIKLSQWFSDNQIKANHDKYHLLVIGKNDVTMNASGFKNKKTVNATRYS